MPTTNPTLLTFLRPKQGDRLPYPLLRVLWARKAIRDVPWRARPRWLWNALTYSYEICFTCGGKVGRHTDSWWWADDALWLEVVGAPNGIYCPPCFTRAARAKGIHVSWHPAVSSRGAS